jgi:phosphoglycolate phosphatase-like HAD superfamily hydrolase
MKYRALVLFDIDGTLVRRAGEHHREALVYGMRRVTGLETSTEGIPVQGMLDPVILWRMAQRAGARRADILASLPAIQRSAERYYTRVVPDLQDKHCPAAAETLERLSSQSILLALVTGNLTRIGWRKLERAGLRRYFRYGAFGEMASTRTGLAKRAIQHAREKQWIERGAPIALVGDATSDIIAAKRNRICSISVETGITPRSELAELMPDYLLPDLRNLRDEMIEFNRKRRRSVL